MGRMFVHQEPQRMGQHGQDGLERGDRAAGGAGQVEDQGLPEQPADAAAQDGEGGFPAAFGAHVFAEAVEQAAANGAGGFRGNVAGGEAGAPGSDEQPAGLRRRAQRVFNGELFVCNKTVGGDAEAGFLQQGDYGRAGQVFALAAGAAVAHGKDKDGNGILHTADCTVWRLPEAAAPRVCERPEQNERMGSCPSLLRPGFALRTDAAD